MGIAPAGPVPNLEGCLDVGATASAVSGSRATARSVGG